MKQLITGIACILLLFAFFSQVTANQSSHSAMLYVENQVDAFSDEIKQAGYITDSAKQSLQTNLATKLECEPNQIIITGDDTAPVMRGTLINYSVTFPLKHVIGASAFWGITEDENTVTKTITGKTASEYVDWD